MQVTEAAVFKNGYSQISLQGSISGQDTKLRLLDVPVPILGSFWWQAPAGTYVKNIRTETTSAQVPKTHYTTLDFLLANCGAQAEIVLSNGSNLSGTICTPPRVSSGSSFLRCHYTAPQDTSKGRLYTSTGITEPKPEQPPVVQLRTGRGIVTLSEQNILYAEVLSPTPQYPTTEKQVPCLTFELSAPAAGQSIQVSSLSRGLSWVPSYRMDLGSDGNANFQCKATVINELADLNNVKLELVMGYPALGKHLIPSPIAQYHSLTDFLNLISTQIPINTGAISSNITSNNTLYASEQQDNSEHLTQAEDLFFYTIPHFSCAAGQTVTQEIFAGEVAYSHVYTWHVPTQSDIENWQRNHQRYYNSNLPAPNEVWHCVRVHNSLKSPWTTGVLDCYAAGKLVGRSEISFTAEGASSLVRLNKTMQTPVQYTETILNRSNENLTLEGKLSITNQSDKEIQVMITKEVNGTPLNASDNAAITCTPDYDNNPDGQFLWKVSVLPGQTKTVTYQYSHQN